MDCHTVHLFAGDGLAFGESPTSSPHEKKSLSSSILPPELLPELFVVTRSKLLRPTEKREREGKKVIVGFILFPPSAHWWLFILSRTDGRWISSPLPPFHDLSWGATKMSNPFTAKLSFSSCQRKNLCVHSLSLLWAHVNSHLSSACCERRRRRRRRQCLNSSSLLEEAQ